MCISVFYIKIMLRLKVYNMLAFLLSHWFYTVFCCYLCVFFCSVSKQFSVRGNQISWRCPCRDAVLKSYVSVNPKWNTDWVAFLQQWAFLCWLVTNNASYSCPAAVGCIYVCKSPSKTINCYFCTALLLQCPPGNPENNLWLGDRSGAAQWPCPSGRKRSQGWLWHQGSSPCSGAVQHTGVW